MDSFLQSGDKQIENFMEEYQERRKVAHLRRIKVDKMKELLARKVSTPSRAAPPPPGASPGYPSLGTPLPYPSHSYSNMPLPPGFR